MTVAGTYDTTGEPVLELTTLFVSSHRTFRTVLPTFFILEVLP